MGRATFHGVFQQKHNVFPMVGSSSIEGDDHVSAGIADWYNLLRQYLQYFQVDRLLSYSNKS